MERPQLHALHERSAAARAGEGVVVAVHHRVDHHGAPTRLEHLATGKHPENSVLIMVFSLVTMLLLGGIGCVKWWLNSHNP